MLKISYIQNDGSKRFGGIPQEHVDLIEKYTKDLAYIDENLVENVKSEIAHLDKIINERIKEQNQ